MTEMALRNKIAVLVVAALLAALAAVLAFSAKPAEAAPCSQPYCGGYPIIPIAPNDYFQSASALKWLQDGTVSGDTTNASLESSEPKPSCAPLGISKSVWYKITPNYTGSLKFSTGGSSFDTVLGLYKGSSLTSLQEDKCSNNSSSSYGGDTMSAQVQGGQTYYLQLSGTGATRSGKFSLATDWGCYYYSYDQVMCPV
jgi:hypothetical protein